MMIVSTGQGDSKISTKCRSKVIIYCTKLLTDSAIMYRASFILWLSFYHILILFKLDK